MLKIKKLFILKKMALYIQEKLLIHRHVDLGSLKIEHMGIVMKELGFKIIPILLFNKQHKL